MKDKLDRIAAHDPHGIAYICGEEILTYGALWAQASAAADRLRRQGAEPVLLYGSKEADMVISIVACLLAQRTYVPVDASTPLIRIRHILDVTGASLILSRTPLPLPHVQCCSLEALSRFDGAEPIPPQGDIGYMIFTSGSTGAPKGVPIPRANLAHFIQWICNLPAMRDIAGGCVLNQASFSFDLSVADLFYSLVSGHTLVAVPQQDSLYSAMAEHRVNAAVVTPTFMKLCLLNPDFNEASFPHFSCVYFCGEVLEKQTVRKLFRAFPHIRILNAYGPTEATSAVSAIEITPEMALSEGPLPVGDRGFFATSIEIEDGEIVLRGPSVFRGYLGSTVGGWFSENGTNGYRTGDLGYIKDGLLYCIGRRDQQVKFKGYRIELTDIEENILQLPYITDCAVVPAYTPEGIVKNIKAFFVAAEETAPQQIKADLASRLPAYMIPRTFRRLDRLPVNQNGKTDRKALMQL